MCVPMNPKKTLRFHCCERIQIPLQVSGICGKYFGDSGKYWSISSSFSGAFLFIFILFVCVGVAYGVVFCPQTQKNIAGALAFWMANASELLNFVKQDRDLSRITLDAQDVLAHLVQMAFK